MTDRPVYKIEQLDFDGPLDLLLVLLEKNKIDIYDIPIAAITEQYLDYVEKLSEQDLDIISDFLVMAATLLEIKSRMLLPRETDENGDEIDPREELIERLLLYKRYKYIASQLRFFEEYAERFVYKNGELPKELKDYEAPLDLSELTNGFTIEDIKETFLMVMHRREESTDKVHRDFGIIKRERISLSGKIQKLVDYTKKHSKFSFREMLGEQKERTEVVVSFLAMLELMKVGKLKAVQQSGDISIEVVDEKDIDISTLDLKGIDDE